MAAKRDDVLADLRRRIVHGELDPGELLPSRLELASHYGVSVVTLQRIFDRLREDGLIVARQRAGTFVADAPPFMTDYALVFPKLPGSADWSRFYEALHDEAVRLHAERGPNIRFYYGLDGGPAEPDYQRLVDDTSAYRIAGHIFATAGMAAGDVAMSPAEMPGAVVTNGSMPEHARAALIIDTDELWTVAAAYLAGQGCRRVAALGTNVERGGRLSPGQEAIMHQAELEVLPHTVMALSPALRDSGRAWVQLLMKSEKSVRPDALFVHDDNLTEPVLRGLVEAGIRVPDDLVVVSHNNFPLSLPDVLPIKTIGFHARTIIEKAMAYVDARRQGRRVSPRIHIPVVDDVQAATFETAVANAALTRKHEALSGASAVAIV